MRTRLGLLSSHSPRRMFIKPFPGKMAQTRRRRQCAKCQPRRMLHTSDGRPERESVALSQRENSKYRKELHEKQKGDVPLLPAPTSVTCAARREKRPINRQIEITASDPRTENKKAQGAVCHIWVHHTMPSSMEGNEDC